MTRNYRIRGNAQLTASTLPAAEVEITRQRRVQPGSARAAGSSDFDADGDEVVRVELENGFVLWTRADDLLRERGRQALGRDGAEGWEIDLRPPARSVRSGPHGERGLAGLGIKLLEFFGVDLKQKAASALGSKLESRLLGGKTPGLYRCALDDTFSLTALPKTGLLPAGPEPLLIFLHGTASSCQGSFGKLWLDTPASQATRQTLKAQYGERAYALEHRSLTVSPIQNALDLVQRLPKGAEVHLVSHSRGGLVGELLCLGQRDKTNDPLQVDLLDTLFSADRTLAEQIGLRPLEAKAGQTRDDAYQADRKALQILLEELDNRAIRITRFVRVACPARGTTLASGRLDRWLSVLDHLTGRGLFGDAIDFLLAVVKERTDPRTLPGLEAMMPGSALTRLLQHPALLTASDLSVIAGDIEGDTLWGQIKLLATDWFYGAEHDLVVNTGSMYGGLRRLEKSARFLRDQGPNVSHFNYFTNDKSVRWLLAGLTRSDDSDGGFQPIQAAKHEEPKWRAAVRRSRSIGSPRPLAVVLPGTMGSALQVGDDAVWLKYLALFKGGLSRLRMDAGQRRSEVKPTDLLDDFYGPLLVFLARSHRVEIFPYDWRLSVRDAAIKLADKLETLLPEAERQNQPVHLVAHSMGGLVVRAMIADGGRGAALWRRIVNLPNSRFLMLGTPNRGSHEAVRWLTGHNPTQAKLSLLDITNSTDEIIGIVNRFPGLLELLPFDADGPDFARQSLWSELRQQLLARWSLADGEALAQARATWDLLKQAAPDPQHMIYVAGCQDATVRDFRLSDYDESYLAGRKRLEFIATHAGDGTVTWHSGRLPGVPTWYVKDTAHDALCTNKRALPGYLDLLMTGATTRLADAPPALSRDAAKAQDSFLLPDLPPSDDIPDEAALSGFGFGPSQPFDATAGQGAPLIQVRLSHGDLAYARHSVLVGHYLGDTIINAEKAVDERLNGVLSNRQRLGLYPGPLGSHALFFNPEANGQPGGAIVVGLGQVGELTPGMLNKSVRDAMLDYALRVAHWPDQRFGKADSVRSAQLTCLLVGSGAGGMTARDSVEAILRGAVAANDKLVAAELEGKVIIDRIEFLELYEDVAIAAAEALESVLRDGELAMQVEWKQGAIEEGQGRRRRVRCDETPNWWQRLEIIEDKLSENLRFIATTDRARAEETLVSGQLRLVEGFIRQASQSSNANAEVAKTLFEMLLPNRLKELAPKQADLVLVLDSASARYPWELLEDRWSQSSRPPAIAAGLLRQLKTPRFRPHPAHASEATAFIVGNPDLAGWASFADLPGARQEAQSVANLLNEKNYFAYSCIDETADSILSGLHKKPWRILHLCGHGEHEFALEGGSGKLLSGMVIGNNTFLTPGDVEQMRWVPELVFINCCHLGKTLGKTAAQGGFSQLAANLAVQFIEMGVKAVVAAGWAVDDSAAEAFAAGFYTHLLAGENFGQAVRAAREEIWVRFPDTNTWGAYQCYGDPGFRLNHDSQPAAQRARKTYHTPSELVADLDNHRAWIGMQMHEQGDDPDEIEALRSDILARLKGIPESMREVWLARGDVAAALGFAWGETGAWNEAVEWLEKALTAQSGDCPVRAVEQCASFRVRLSGDRWQALRDAAGLTDDEIARQSLIGEIENAIRELDMINLRAPTPERLSLLGSACKRLAWIGNEAAPRLEALVNMANYYRQAHELETLKARIRGELPDPAHFTHWATAKVIIGLFDAEQDPSWRNTLEDDCRQIIRIARERSSTQPNFADGVAEADCELALLLARRPQQAEAAQADSSRIAALYRCAAQRGVSPREYASVREHVDFVIALVQAASDQAILVAALVALNAAL